MINYFNFKKLENNKYLITNDFGRYAFINGEDFDNLVNNKIAEDSPLGKELSNKLFILPDSFSKLVELTRESYRAVKRYLFTATSLHIFVLTNECNLRCVYCQARDNSKHKPGYMPFEVAEKAVDIALQSPEKYLDFEFQGGEPLVNFKTLKHIVEYAEANKGFHNIRYSVVTNLLLMTEEMLSFLNSHSVSISTSLDGPECVHNKNRVFLDGSFTYELVKEKIENLKRNNIHVGAIETTTKHSLNYPKEIVDSYVNLGFNDIFLRPLTKLGTAKERWDDIGYDPEEFEKFYSDSLDYILELNKKGIFIREGHAAIILPKMFGSNSPNYMELRSPCGASIGQAAYYYDGNIFTCDEGRMLSEMGDDSFKIGNVYESDFNQMTSCSACKTTCAASITESLPGCSDCVYQPYCGVCPVASYAEENNIFKREVNYYRCSIFKAIIKKLFSILEHANEEELTILESWFH